jgi:glycosyltransferase involved in cell wall biosynthesis
MPNSKKKPCLLAVGDAVATTGFSRVTRNILEPISLRFEIHQIAVNYYGDPHDLPWKLYPASLAGDPLGATRLRPLTEKCKPDLIFLVGNLPRIVSYVNALGDLATRIPIVAYCPVEAAPIPPARFAELCGVNILVFYTQFAKKEFGIAIERSGHEASKEDVSDIRVIPHGIDSEMFFPLEIENPDRDAVKQRAKDKLFRGDEEHANSFVVLNSNRNERRKRIDMTIKGFADFARDKDRFVKLHLHMGNEDVGWKIVDMCHRFGIYDRLIMTNHSKGLPSVDTEELNLIYNAADVGINTSSSEGWGLVSFEQAATRTAQIVPRHASCEELWSDTAQMMEPGLVIVDPQSMTDQHIVSPGTVAAALETLYSDQEQRQTVADRCYERATHPDFQWSKISGQWESIFNELL